MKKLSIFIILFLMVSMISVTSVQAGPSCTIGANFCLVENPGGGSSTPKSIQIRSYYKDYAFPIDDVIHEVGYFYTKTDLVNYLNNIKLTNESSFLESVIEGYSWNVLSDILENGDFEGIFKLENLTEAIYSTLLTNAFNQYERNTEVNNAINVANAASYTHFRVVLSLYRYVAGNVDYLIEVTEWSGANYEVEAMWSTLNSQVAQGSLVYIGTIEVD